MTHRHAGNRLLRIIAVSSALVMVAGCSSSSKTSTPGAPTPGAPTRTQPPPPAGGFVDTSFRSKVAATCTTAGTALAAEGPFPYPDFDPEHPLVTDFAGIASYEAKTVAALRAWKAALHALGQPTAGSTNWNAFLAAVDKDVASTVDQQQAAKRNDSAAFTKTFHDLSATGPANTRAAAAIGTPSCDPSNLK